MARQSYFGLDTDDDHLWTLAQCIDGKTIVLQRFRNTLDGLSAIERFIRDQSGRPRICIKLSNASTLNLVEYLSGIPGVEVILINEVGFQKYQLWSSTPKQTPSLENPFRAEILARCAERII